MHRIKLGVFSLGVFFLSLAPSAMADDPSTRSTISPAQPKPTLEAAPKFTCSINPPTGKPSPHLTTAVTVKKTSGVLKNDTEVLIKLGLAASGIGLAHVCGYHYSERHGNDTPGDCSRYQRSQLHLDLQRCCWEAQVQAYASATEVGFNSSLC